MSTIPPPSTMKAYISLRAGDPQTVLSHTSHHPKPTLATPSQVVVRISHCALNIGSSILITMVPHFLRKSPAVPEMDFAGTIEAVGSSVQSFDRGLGVGTRVFGSILVPAHFKGAGAMAEYVVVEEGSVVRTPENMQQEEAAGLGIAGSTAIEVVAHAKLKEGDKVLVYGASGGVGTIVTQLARNVVGETGRIVGVCSERNAELVRGLGADHVIDYTAHPDMAAYLKEQYGDTPFDAILDARGVPSLFQSSPGFLKKDGVFSSVGVMFNRIRLVEMLWSVAAMASNSIWPVWLGGTPRRYLAVNAVSTTAHMEKLREMVEAGKLKGVVDSVWEFENAVKAYERLLSKRAAGKVIVKID